MYKTKKETSRTTEKVKILNVNLRVCPQKVLFAFSGLVLIFIGVEFKKSVSNEN